MFTLKSKQKKVIPPEYSNIWWLKIITSIFLFSFTFLSGYVVWITYYSTFRIAEYGIDVISLEQAQIKPIDFTALEQAKAIEQQKRTLTSPLISRNVFFHFGESPPPTIDTSEITFGDEYAEDSENIVPPTAETEGNGELSPISAENFLDEELLLDNDELLSE